MRLVGGVCVVDVMVTLSRDTLIQQCFSHSRIPDLYLLIRTCKYVYYLIRLRIGHTRFINCTFATFYIVWNAYFKEVGKYQGTLCTRCSIRVVTNLVCRLHPVGGACGVDVMATPSRDTLIQQCLSHKRMPDLYLHIRSCRYVIYIACN